MRLSCVSVCADSMMPKRKNPFGAITPLQRKMHVGFEQMATQQEREEVYGETCVSSCIYTLHYLPSASMARCMYIHVVYQWSAVSLPSYSACL